MHLKIITTLRLSNHKLKARVGLSVMLARMEKYMSKRNVISESNIDDKVFIFKIVFSNL